MRTSVKNCIIIFVLSGLTGLTVFLLSLFNVLVLDALTALFPYLMITALVLYAVFFTSLIHTDKNMLVREAVCCCGKTAMIGFIGTLTLVPFTLLLFNSTIKILFDLALGAVFFFHVMMLAGTGCILTVMYQCRKHNC